MFSALACIAFAFSSFASNEIVKEEKLTNDVNTIRFENSTEEVNEEFAITPCNFKINTVDQNENIIKTKRYTNVNPSPF